MPRDTQAARSDAFEHRTVDVGAVKLHVVEAGRGEGRPLVVLLHGFPEFWFSYRHQIGALAEAGCHVVAPDLRGYHLSDKPSGVENYVHPAIVRDVVGLIRACGRERATVVGHDWGGAIAWFVAQDEPARVERLVTLNCPHPARLLRGLSSPAQLWRSSYMLFFQLPHVPEWCFRARRFRSLRRLFEQHGLPAAEVEEYVQAAQVAGDSLKGAIHYYRAALRHSLFGGRPTFSTIRTPTLVIWGERDRFLGKELATPDAELVTNARVVFLPDVGHFVHWESPERVNQLLKDFILEAPPAL